MKPLLASLLPVFFICILISCATESTSLHNDNRSAVLRAELLRGRSEAVSVSDSSAAGRHETTAPEDTPIILVHGFGGWGREDIPSFFYWGGFTDLQGELRAAGYTVYTASLGPFSSNRDRACELYAFIKGGRVDYGKHHSDLHGHRRYGKTYPGVHPGWDKENPVHIIGHSMGGQTARLLAYLLRHGDPDEARVSGDSCNRLFSPGDQLVRSIITVSTPHNGTTLVSDIDLIDTIIDTTIIGLATLVESKLFPDFDLKMAQWGITRETDEPLSAYFSRLRKREIWSATNKDFSLWDCSIEGAAALNRLTPAEPDVYYFSVANEETTGGPLRKHQIPEIGMLAPFIPGAFFLGSHIEESVYQTDTSWWPNDGVVNTCSMRGPFLETQDVIKDFTGSPEPGIWNYLGVLDSMDHGDVIGVPSAQMVKPEGFDSIVDFYLYMCDILNGLPL